MQQATQEAPEPRYAAFLSYSHSDDKAVGWFHRKIESYRTPRALAGQAGKFGGVKKRLRPVFRDREELTASCEALFIRPRDGLGLKQMDDRAIPGE